MIIAISKLPLYLRYIVRGTPCMYSIDPHTNRMDLNRPAYSICSDEQGQAPWVNAAGFTAANLEDGEGDEVDAADFFDPNRSSSLDITAEADDGSIFMYEHMFVTAYFLIDCETKRWSVKGEDLKHALITASTDPIVPTFK